MFLSWYQLLPGDGSGIRSSHPVVPVWKLFEDDSSGSLKDKIVLVGSSASMFRDYHKTPLSNRHLGTDIHATAVHTLLDKGTVRFTPPGFGMVLTIVLLTVVFSMRVLMHNTSRAVLYGCGLIVFYVWFSYTQFKYMHLYMPVLTPVFGMLVGFLMASMWGLNLREKQVALLEQNLSQLVSASVLNEIRRRKHSIEPGGQRMEITSMFVDIRNFTAQAENLPSGELTAMLNTFYARVVDIVFEHEGTIDKFMGDGILVMFGAPIPDVSHRQKAVACAQEILQKVPEDIGISLNSGMAFVGFVGPRHKLEYTAVGDTVNLCVRLQDHNKQYNTRLILGEATAEPFLAAETESGVRLKKLDTVTVRGREAEIAIYTLF